MSRTENHSSADVEWRQLEAFVEQLHELSRAPIEAQEFYRRLLDGCVTLLAAEGGAVWLPIGRGRWQQLHQVNAEQVPADEDSSRDAAHFDLLQSVVGVAEPQIVLPNSRGAAGGKNSTAWVVALAAVHDVTQPASDQEVHAVLELFLRPGSSPDAQHGWQDFLTTVSQVAGEFHVHEQLRLLRLERGFYDQSLELMRRFQRASDVRQTAFEIANEGRRFVAGDRLSVVVRQGKNWRLLAASGVDRVETRADVTKRLQMLAAATADWGEPLEYADAMSEEFQDLPPELAGLVERHLDESQARRLVAVPLVPKAESWDQSRPSRVTAVLVAEQFSSETGEFSRQRVLELAGLCEPALRQAMQLDRFPIRNCLRSADRWAQVTEKLGLTKLSVAAAAAVMVLLALVFVRCDFEVEAPATLKPLVERDIFATADSKVVEVRIAHGEPVEAGDVLAVLDDPQLSLDVQRVQGEIETTGKRLEAIAVARTDRQVREEGTNEKLPLSAEAEQLQMRLKSLRSQHEILTKRREALTLRSPIAGIVLTLDVQNLLQTRPVERGQVLFTVANSAGGWKLLAEMPQDRIGHVVAAQRDEGMQLPVRFRLAGDPEQTYLGHVEAISAAAVLDTTGLDQESPAIELNIEVDERDLPLARPGMSARVRVLCGRRSLGYVWLHDIYETLYSWLVF